MNYNSEYVSLEAVSEELGDGLHKAPKFVPYGEYLFVNATNLENGYIVDKDPLKRTSYEEYLKYGVELNNETILYSIDGTIGNIAKYRGEKCVLGKGACYIKVKKEIDANFIYYQLQSSHFKSYINSMATGSTIRHISLRTMRNYTFELPNLEYQRKIASILSAIDAKIILNTHVNDNLANLLQTAYQKQFCDVSKAAAQGILSDICSYSRERVAVSELNVSTYFSTENMLPGKAGATEATSLPTAPMTTACHKGDTLISNIRPYFKKIVYCADECGCSTDVLCFTPSQSRYAAYLFSTLYADKFFAFMVAGSKGTKMPRGDKQQIMTYPVALPSNEELEEFNALALPILAQIHSNIGENERLAELRDAVLPKLMSGEIDVSDLSL